MTQRPGEPLPAPREAFEYSQPTRLVFGTGRLGDLPRLVDEWAGPVAKVLLVTGRSNLRSTGVLDAVCLSLSPHRITLFDRVPTNPSPEITQQAIDLCRSNECNIVVAIGGGSPLDVGKITALLAPGSADLMSYQREPKTISFEGLPCIAVPTTSGSSSEVTPFAVTWDKEAAVRYPLAHPGLYPKVAIVDPDLTVSMPPDLAASTGMDAFTSAFEAYWSSYAQPVSDVLALECISLYRDNLESSCLEGSADARAKCALASSLSGMAYSSARTTAPHAFGTPLSLFFGTVHGEAVGVTLPAFLYWNAPTFERKLEPLLKAMRCASLDEVAQTLTGMMQHCGVNTRLAELGVGRNDLPRISDRALIEPQMQFNPRPMTVDEGVSLLEGLL
jgi:alcohol dehydrogenase class IV